MKIDVELSIQSIEQAKKKLKRIEKLFKNGALIKEFTEDVCLWVINRANRYIENSDIGELVKLQIRNGWEYDITANGATIKNRTEKAVFVEFGVGIIGQSHPHPNAGVEGYEYNVQNYYVETLSGKLKPVKDSSGMWYFWTNHSELDIPRNAIEDIRGYDDFRGKGNEQGKRIIVGTRGTEGVMYAYNAIVDARKELKTPDSELALKWQKLLERYLG